MAEDADTGDIEVVVETEFVDVDGDGVPDIIESTTITGVDVNRDGSIDEDEIEIETTVAVREDLLDDGESPLAP